MKINEEFIQEVKYIESEITKLEAVNLEPIDVKIIDLQYINEESPSEEFTSEEIAKLKEVRRLLEQDKVMGQKVLNLIDKGLIILEVYDAMEYVDDNGNKKSFDGYHFYATQEGHDIIGFQIKEKDAKQIAQTIIHEYVHLTQKGKGMTRIEREYEAYIKGNEFFKRLMQKKDVPLTSDEIKNIKKMVTALYASYKEGEFEEILDNVYEKEIVNKRIIKL